MIDLAARNLRAVDAEHALGVFLVGDANIDVLHETTHHFTRLLFAP